MILPTLYVTPRLIGNFFYFAADSNYFDLYGKALALSLIKHAPWANIHVHLYNSTPHQIEWCTNKRISVTEESIQIDHPEFRTLCACIRFIRVPEIFDASARIVSFDCDVIANNSIPRELFMKETEESGITIRKGGKSLASSVAFGLDDFRNEYRQRLLDQFDKDNIYWFLDQDVLDHMKSENKIRPLSPSWNSTKMTSDRMIWTAKGTLKTQKKQYIDLLTFYNSL